MTLNKKDRSQLTLFMGPPDTGDGTATARTYPFKFERVQEFTDALRASVQLYKMQQKAAVDVTADEKYVPPSNDEPKEQGTAEESEPMI